nr:helix-turn-helix domain-containing protein [Odoribacter sp. OF09-27XD]
MGRLYGYRRRYLDALYTHMRKLRKKLQDAGAEDYIETIYAVGYKFTLKEK